MANNTGGNHSQSAGEGGPEKKYTGRPAGPSESNFDVGKCQQRDVSLAVHKRCKDEELRVDYSTYTREDGKSFDYVAIRAFHRFDRKDWRPGQRGIWIRLKELAKVRRAIEEAEEIAAAHFEGDR